MYKWIHITVNPADFLRLSVGLTFAASVVFYALLHPPPAVAPEQGAVASVAPAVGGTNWPPLLINVVGAVGVADTLRHPSPHPALHPGLTRDVGARACISKTIRCKLHHCACLVITLYMNYRIATLGITWHLHT